MPKLNGPLMSLSAHGTIANKLTYQQRKRGNKVRLKNKPKSFASPKQRERRRLQEFFTAHWKGITQEQKQRWQDQATQKKTGLPGYQYFLKQCYNETKETNGLIAYYSMNYLNGVVVPDISGNNNYLVLSSYTGPTYPKIAEGKNIRFNNCLEYTDYRERCRRNKDFVEKEGSIELWLNVKVLGYLRATFIAGSMPPMYTPRLIIGFATGNWAYFSINNGMGQSVIIQSIIEWKINEWFCMVATWKDNEVKFFVNNEQQGITETNIIMPESWGDWVALGNGILFNYQALQKIDEVCIYNRVFTDEERTLRYKYAMKEIKENKRNINK